MKYKLNAMIKLLLMLVNAFHPARLKMVYENLLQLERCKAKLNELGQAVDDKYDDEALERYSDLYFDIYQDVQGAFCADVHD